MANMITTARAAATGKSVLLYSGGMDSVCFDHLLKPDVLLYVPTGAAYEHIETAMIGSMASEGHISKPKRLTVLSNVLHLGAFERDDAIVPNRNAHLVLLASHYGETIYLASVSGDRSLDKDDLFYTRIKALLDHMWAEQHWTEARRFEVCSPFKLVTKTLLVNQFLATGGNPATLLRSYSCYGGKPQACGVCKPCARKWVALENNNIAIPDGYFTAPFWLADWFGALLPAIVHGTYRGDEDADFQRFMRRRRIGGLG